MCVFRSYYRLRHKIQIVIGTPGRINDVIDNHEDSLRLRHIKMIVLDEVDVMLQMGFLNQVRHFFCLRFFAVYSIASKMKELYHNNLIFRFSFF